MAVWRAFLLAAFSIACLALPASAAESDTYADIIAKVLPSVVNISIKGMGETPMMDNQAKSVAYAPHIVDLVGSGSIVDSTGLIVTNKHVIDNAYEIMVTLQDGTTVNARLLGKGLGFDLAVLKIEVGYPLPAIKVGDSDALRVGDRVFAVGNPLGLKSSVTSGIVSALHRDLNGSPYDEFIQTDAAINHGNSGGPLFNTKGEVIGINNQIYSESATSGSIGLGFAIPSNDVQFLMDQIRKHGRPHLGWLGLRIQTVTAEMADALMIPMQSGAIIAEVTPGGPADEAGLQVGEIIQAFADERVIDYRTLNRAVAMAVGQTMRIHVWHLGGQERIIPVQVKEWPQELWVSYKSEAMRPPLFNKLSDFGFQMTDLNDELRARFHIDPGTMGPVVTDVVDETAASGARLKPGDVVLKVQLEDVHSKADFEQRLKELTDKGQRNALIFAKTAAGVARWTTLPLRL
ncbi:MAG: DegQ family serine endoprotease [Beijerinckiaceae bacterium]